MNGNRDFGGIVPIGNSLEHAEVTVNGGILQAHQESLENGHILVKNGEVRLRGQALRGGTLTTNVTMEECKILPNAQTLPNSHIPVHRLKRLADNQVHRLNARLKA